MELQPVQNPLVSREWGFSPIKGAIDWVFGVFYTVPEGLRIGYVTLVGLKMARVLFYDPLFFQRFFPGKNLWVFSFYGILMNI